MIEHADPEIRITHGSILGAHEGRLRVFRGIPYAAPPVGADRFAPPRRPGAWRGVRPATTFGPPAPQPGALGRVRSGGSRDGDWLTLNVWTPADEAGASLPVVVWIHGGAYVVGDSAAPEFDGSRLAEEGDVVVVSFNYRLGMEGFAQLAGAPANRGLLDQVAALQWVQDEISSFGGDPDAVTIVGESAGAGSVAALLVMPEASGLFARAIAQSVPGVFLTPALAADIATVVVGRLSRDATVADLMDVAPERLVEAAEATSGSAAPDRWGAAGYRSVLFAPVVDGEYLPSTPWAGLAAGASRDVPLLVMHTREEHRLFMLLSGTLGRVTTEQVERDLRALAPDPRGPDRYRAAYPDAGPEALHELVHSDWLFRMPSLHLADAHVAGGGQTYLAELTWPAPGLGGTLGACHGLDVPLVFGNLTDGQPALLIGGDPTGEAQALSTRMRADWISFVTHGDPSWPQYTPAARLTRIYDRTIRVTEYPEERSRRIWDDHRFDAIGLQAKAAR